MRTRARALLPPLAAATAGALLLAWLGLKTMAFSDYETEAEPALMLLRAGDLGGFVASLPAYGGSLVMRSPFAFLPGLWDGGDLALFRAMAAPCLAAGVILGVALWERGRQLGLGAGARWVALALCAVNPLTLRALEIGHPEELLGGALCVGAGLAAASRCSVLAGVLLGLAIVNKPWAVLAIVPVLAIAPEGRLKLLAIAGGVTAAVFGPLLLAGSAAIEQTGEAASDAGQIFQPWQVWWFVGDHGQVVMGAFGEKPGFRAAPDWIGQVARPLVAIVPARRSPSLFFRACAGALATTGCCCSRWCCCCAACSIRGTSSTTSCPSCSRWWRGRSTRARACRSSRSAPPCSAGSRWSSCRRRSRPTSRPSPIWPGPCRSRSCSASAWRRRIASARASTPYGNRPSSRSLARWAWRVSAAAGRSSAGASDQTSSSRSS